MAKDVGKNATVKDTGIEGREDPKMTVRTDKARKGGKKGAGHIGGSNVNHS